MAEEQTKIKPYVTQVFFKKRHIQRCEKIFIVCLFKNHLKFLMVVLYCLIHVDTRDNLNFL